MRASVLLPLSICPRSRMSSTEEPINAQNLPGSTAHACLDTSQIEKLLSSSSKSTDVLSLGASDRSSSTE